jgi:hypothetical protein
MSESSASSARNNQRLDPLRCGDCRMPLPPKQPLRSEPGVYYCPGCAKPIDETLTCPHCGSLICPRCGTPLESADDLGIG